MGFSYFESMHLPIFKRRWFLERTNAEIKKSQTSKGHQDNDPETRAMMGRARAQVPSKLRRFS
jgi:hypothetical protein